MPVRDPGGELLLTQLDDTASRDAVTATIAACNRGPKQLAAICAGSVAVGV